MSKKLKKTDIAAIPFDQVLAALQDMEHPFPPAYVYRLSGLEEAELAQFAEHWAAVAVERRRAILADIALFSTDDMLLDFEAVCWVALRDADPQVQLSAIEAMGEQDAPRYARFLLDLIRKSPVVEVRAAAAAALSNYMYLGELEEISEPLHADVEKALFLLLAGDDHPLVRRKALEAAGYSQDERIDGYIRAASQRDDDEWLAAALVAMGRSANPEWRKETLAAAKHASPLVREAAARAIGGLEFKDADKPLIRLLDDEDVEVRTAAIWSLTVIGGKAAQKALTARLEEAVDEDEIDLLEEALENLSFGSNLESLRMFEFDEDDQQDSIYEFDPDEDDDF